MRNLWRSHLAISLLAPAAMVLALAACGNDDNAFDANGPAETAGEPTTPNDRARDTPEADSGETVFTTSASDGGVLEIRYGNNRIELVEVRASDGWDYHDDEDDDDEVEIEFRQSSREIQFEAELEDSRLKVEVDDKFREASDGTHMVRAAGEIEFQRNGDDLTLIEVRPNRGWDHTVEADEDDEIDVDFRRDRDRVTFEVGIDDGRLEVDIDSEEYFDLD